MIVINWRCGGSRNGRKVRTAVTQVVKMLHDARMAAMAKPHCGDGYVDGRRQWAVCDQCRSTHISTLRAGSCRSLRRAPRSALRTRKQLSNRPPKRKRPRYRRSFPVCNQEPSSYACPEQLALGLTASLNSRRFLWPSYPKKPPDGQFQSIPCPADPAGRQLWPARVGSDRSLLSAPVPGVGVELPMPLTCDLPGTSALDRVRATDTPCFLFESAHCYLK
jgi:hypothetical protein